MLRRRKLKPRQVDPAEEAAHTAEWNKQLVKSRRMMKTFDTLPSVCRQALAQEPTGSIDVADVKQMAAKIASGRYPAHIDLRYLANHIIECGRTVYENTYGRKKPAR